MTCLKLTLPASGNMPVPLTLAQAFSAHELLQLEHAAMYTRALMRRELARAEVADALGQTLTRQDAGAVEYASWLPDPGALEVASWASTMRSMAR